jgi:phage protein D/phage baseplate assembly protein gpV
MPETAHISHLTIKIEGAVLAAEAVSALDEVVVDHSLHVPSMFTLRLFSTDMRWLEDETFREGKKVEIQAGEPPETVLTGKIAALEPDLNQDLPRLVVRGYDLSHKLYRGKHRRSFNNVTDDDLARQLAQESGLRTGTIDSPPGAPHEYVYQNNQTNAEFLGERARRLGFELFVEDESLHFRRPPRTGETVQLAWGSNLRSFRARMSTAEQVNEVEVRGWDPKQKEKVEGRAARGTGSPEIGINQPGADLARNAWGEAKLAIYDQFVRSPADAELLAQSALDELSSSFVEAEGTCDGNAAVRPGKQVEISGVGSRFNGKYYVTSVVHEWNTTQGLRTHFVISGRRDNGVWSLLETLPERKPDLGLVIGVVTNNQDPEGLMRVRVRFPWLSDSDESAWARLVTPMAGNGRGFMYIPEVDDEVVVAFEHGDIHRPYVLGALWNGKDAPPLSQSQAVSGSGEVNKRIIKSRAGHIILLDDTSGAEEITIIDKTGNNKIVLHSPDNSLQIKVQGDLTLEAQGKIILKAAAGMDMSSDASLSLKGATGSIEASGSMTVKNGAGGQIAFNGPTVSINNGALEVT